MVAGLPVPTPRTWVPGDGITAQRLNSNVRDPINFLTSPPMFSGLQSSAAVQTVQPTTWTSLALDSTLIDTYQGHAATPNSRYVCQLAGVYEIHGVAVFDTGGGVGGRGTAIAVNGARVPGSGSLAQASQTNGSPTAVPAYLLTHLNFDDFVEVQGWQASGGPLGTISNTDYASTLFVVWRHA